MVDGMDVPDLLDYKGEFGPELILYRPYLNWLDAAGLLKGKTIRTYTGMSCFYKHLGCQILEKNEKRAYVPAGERARFLPIKNEHDFDGGRRSPYHLFDDLRSLFSSVKLYPELEVAIRDRPLLIVHNKITDEWSSGPVNNLDAEILEEIFSTLSGEYFIVYIRHGMQGDSSFIEDHAKFIKLDYDEELVRKYNIATFDRLFQENCKVMNVNDLNEFKNALYSRSYHFITSQGGGAHQICCFSGSVMMILHRAGSEEAWAYDQGYYGFASNPAPIRMVFRSSAEMKSGLPVFHRPTVAGGRACPPPSEWQLINKFAPSRLSHRRSA